MLTADCERCTSGAAPDSEPASTTATKARSQSSCRSRMAGFRSNHSKIEW